MAATEDKKSVAEVMAWAQKKHSLRVSPITDIQENIPAISTGNMAIDYIVGCAGFPLGRMIELYGPPSSGKSTSAIMTAAELQRIIKEGGDPERGIAADDLIVYADHEHAFDPSYALALGLDVTHESFLFTQPDSLEQSFNVVRELIRTGKVRMVIWDSVAAMTPEAALLADAGSAPIAMTQARLMAESLKPLVSELHHHNTVAIFINHLTEKYNLTGYSKGGPQTTTPGGKALKFYASIRIEYKQIKTTKGMVFNELLNEKEEFVVSTDVLVKVVKNKLAPPFKTVTVRVRFGKGFDNFYTALQILVAHKVIPYSAGIFYFDKVPTLIHPDMAIGATSTKRPYVKGEENILAFADERQEWRAKVIKAAELIVTKGGASLEAIARTVEEEPDPEEEILTV